MTSNLGSEYLASDAVADDEESVEAVRPLVMDAVRKHFRPEFLNRIDEIMLFQRLGRAQMDSIVKIQLEPRREAAGRPPHGDPPRCRRHALAGRARLRPDLWRAPLKARDPEGAVDPIARKLLAGELDDGAVIEVTNGGDKLEIGRAAVH